MSRTAPAVDTGGSIRWWVMTVVLLLVAGGSFTVAAADRGVLAAGAEPSTEVPATSVRPVVAPDTAPDAAPAGPAEPAPIDVGSTRAATPSGKKPIATAESGTVPTGPSTARVAPTPRTEQARPSAASTRVPAAATDRSVPVGLRIPAIGVSVSVSELGLNPDDTVEVPIDFQKPGWFGLGPTPGQTGSAVILGHVDSTRGPAVFYRLRNLRAGDTVEVGLADGTVGRFVVDSVATYPKKQFPAREVYASRGYPALQLVTCGGEFDRRTGHYLSNVVVFTTLVATTPAGS